MANAVRMISMWAQVDYKLPAQYHGRAEFMSGGEGYLTQQGITDIYFYHIPGHAEGQVLPPPLHATSYRITNFQVLWHTSGLTYINVLAPSDSTDSGIKSFTCNQKSFCRLHWY